MSHRRAALRRSFLNLLRLAAASQEERVPSTGETGGQNSLRLPEKGSWEFTCMAFSRQQSSKLPKPNVYQRNTRHNLSVCEHTHKIRITSARRSRNACLLRGKCHKRDGDVGKLTFPTPKFGMKKFQTYRKVERIV